MNYFEMAAEASTIFEKNNTELKKKYIIKNIDLINTIMEQVSGYCGSFGTGYPFYALEDGFKGGLPIISEQIRYNNELLEFSEGYNTEWKCANCLRINGDMMPDLKQICKPCPNVDDNLKPRKVINRLPDIDMWIVVLDRELDNAKHELNRLLDFYGLKTSDIDPIEAIKNVNSIANDIENGIMPSKYLPIDVHIIEYSKLSRLFVDVPMVLYDSMLDGTTPYLAIHPLSLRKSWQYDDVAYNFVLDYLFSFTPFNLEDELSRKLNYSRKVISDNFTGDQLLEILHSISGESVRRRFENETIKGCYEKRLKRWKK